MTTRLAWVFLTVLTLAIIVLAVVLFVVPSPVAAPTVPALPSNPAAPIPGDQPSAPQALHAKVSVTSPKSGDTVGKSFIVSGRAPGNWFFEASFPIQVRDKDNSKIGQGIAKAQSDWMTTKQVPFTASITVSNYSGPATLILLRDNPSGLPENDDALEVPITIQ